MGFKRYLAFAYYSGAIGDVEHAFEGDSDSVEAAHTSLDDTDYDRCEILDLQECEWASFKRTSGNLDRTSTWAPIPPDDEPLTAEALDKFDS